MQLELGRWEINKNCSLKDSKENNTLKSGRYDRKWRVSNMAKTGHISYRIAWSDGQLNTAIKLELSYY
jgi:hypothetical protein